MSAETQCFVMILRTRKEYVQVSAITLDDARAKAKRHRDVAYVAGASYEESDYEGVPRSNIEID